MNQKFYGRIVNLRVHKKTIFADILNKNGRKQLMIDRNLYDTNSFNEGTIISGQGYISSSKTGDEVIIPNNYEILLKPQKYIGEDYLNRRRIYEKSKLIDIIKSELRKNDFLEVITSTLLSFPGNSSIDPFATTTKDHKEKYLRFTLEMELKKICSNTQFPVYEIGNVFRNMGVDRRHPTYEYTVLEAIYPYAEFEEGIRICSDIFYKYAESVRCSLPELSKKNIFKMLSKYPPEEWNEKYKKGIRLVKNPTLFISPPSKWSPLSKKNKDNTAQDAEIVYKELAIAHICEENNDIEEILRNLKEQCEHNGKSLEDVDPSFLVALQQGLPPSTGFCLGIDRMINIFMESEDEKK